MRIQQQQTEGGLPGKAPAHTNSAFDPVKLTPQLSQAARRERGLSQRDVIQATGIRGYKIKQWEARGLGIDLADMRRLSEYYESIGVDLDELCRYIQAGRSVPVPVDATPGERVASASAAELAFLPRPGFLLSPDLPASVVDKIQTDMEESDNRIGEIIQAGLKKGLFGELSSETEGLVQELFAHLAINYIRFRCLQGRNIVGPTRDEARTVGHFLASWVQGQGVELADKAPPVSRVDYVDVIPAERDDQLAETE